MRSLKGALKKAVSNPRLASLEVGRRLNRFYHTRAYTRDGAPNGTNIFEEDWDNLIILDACRYDFLQEYEFQAEVGVRFSKGSATREFITTNFEDRQLLDVVYVSANYWYPRLKEDINSDIYKFINLQKDEYQDPKTGVEPPSVVADKAREAEEDHPNKRLLIHFIQPHYPYIGAMGKETFTHNENMEKSILDADVDRETVVQAYRENLDLVVPVVKELVKDLHGKTVVTADHGEILGERSFPLPYTEYGHPRGTYVEELVKVPWIEFDYDQRKEIAPGKETHDSEINESEIEDRLKALGYKE